MTVYHPTSCTECEALKLGDCSTCEMSKWRTAQNVLAWVIALETIAALSAFVYYAVFYGAATDSFIKFGDPFYASKIAASATFVGLVVLFALREQITAWLVNMAATVQRYKAIEDEEEDEDDE